MYHIEDWWVIQKTTALLGKSKDGFYHSYLEEARPWRSIISTINQWHTPRKCFRPAAVFHVHKRFTWYREYNLEYAQAVWHPHLLKHKRKIENIQIGATKLNDGLKCLPLWRSSEEVKPVNPGILKRTWRYDRSVKPKSPVWEKCANYRRSRKQNFQLENLPADGLEEYRSTRFISEPEPTGSGTISQAKWSTQKL